MNAKQKGKCRICEDARRAEIDAALLLGRGLRSVAQEFKLARSTLHKHCQRHLRAVAERAVNRLTAAYTRDLRHYLKQVQAEVLMVLTSARTSGDSATALAAAAEARAVAETMRKLLTRTAQPKAKGKHPEPREIELTYEGGEEAHVV